MKIGVMIPLKKNSDIDMEFARAKELQLNCCQLSVWDPTLYNPDTAKALRDASEIYGVEITALWAGYTGPCEWNFTYGPATIGLVPPAYRFQRLKELYQASDFALELGVTDIITHVGFIPINPDNPEFTGTVAVLRRLCKDMAKRGQWFLFETGQETPVTILRTIEAIGTENLGINFDTANLILYGMANSVDALDVFGKYVRNTHFKDGFYPTCGAKLGCEVAMGDGKANFPAIIAKLKELNYAGPYIIEREISGEKQTADIIRGRDMLLSLLK